MKTRSLGDRHIGVASAGCLAKDGCRAIDVDPAQSRVGQKNDGCD